MSSAQFRGIALYKRSAWRKGIDEAKVDMGLIDPFSRQALDYSLYMAVIEDHYKGIGEMVRMGADPNLWIEAQEDQPAGTLLHLAAGKSSLRTVIALLHAGADLLAKDAGGRSPRESLPQKSAASRIKTVLKLWEQRRTIAANENSVIRFDALLQDSVA